MFDNENEPMSPVMEFLSLIDKEVDELGGPDQVTEERAKGYVKSVVEFCGPDAEKFADLLASVISKGLLALNPQVEDWDGMVMLITNPETPYMIASAIYTLIEEVDPEYRDKLCAQIIGYFMSRVLEIGGSAEFNYVDPVDINNIDWDDVIFRITGEST